MRPMTNGRAYEPGNAMLVASSVGTAIASVCVLGVLMIHRAVPGLWALAAIAVAFAICRYLAGIFAHLVKTVPSGAGMFAFVSRAWGPAAGMLVVAPYLMLMILLGSLEALIVGHLASRWLPISPLALACAFLLLSWLICATGLRFGFRIQALATGLLVAGVICGVAWMLASTAVVPAFTSLLHGPAPTIAAFASAVGQAVFLFMGFELVCSHIESTRAEKISWSLKAAVAVLGLLYACVLLALGMADPSGAAGNPSAAWLAPFDFADAQASIAPPDAAYAITLALCLLASITSLNGAFMGLSRLVAVMAAQRVLPVALAKVHAPSLVPRRALALLLAASLTGTFVIATFGLHQAVLLAAAVAATTLYAVALCVRGRSPFAGSKSPPTTFNRMLAILLLALGAGVIIDAGESRGALAILLVGTFGAGLAAAFRLRALYNRPVVTA
jgi:amino acid transporter